MSRRHHHRPRRHLHDPTQLRLVISNQLGVARFIAHHFTPDQFREGRRRVARAGDTGALNVVLTRS